MLIEDEEYETVATLAQRWQMNYHTLLRRVYKHGVKKKIIGVNHVVIHVQQASEKCRGK